MYGTNSPIWDPDFSQNAANVAGSPPTTRKHWSNTYMYHTNDIHVHTVLHIQDKYNQLMSYTRFNLWILIFELQKIGGQYA